MEGEKINGGKEYVVTGNAKGSKWPFKQPLFMGDTVYHSFNHILRRYMLTSILVNAGSIKCVL